MKLSGVSKFTAAYVVGILENIGDQCYLMGKAQVKGKDL